MHQYHNVSAQIFWLKQATANVKEKLSVEISHRSREYDKAAAQGRMQLYDINSGSTEERRSQCFDTCGACGGVKQLYWTCDQFASKSLGHFGSSYHKGLMERKGQKSEPAWSTSRLPRPISAS